MPTEKIRVKMMSEAAEYVTISPVVQRDHTLAELIELMLPVLGRDADRIGQLLRAGTFSNGDFRYRWQAAEVTPEEITLVLSSLPGPDPSREFRLENCHRVRFRRGAESLDLSRERAEKKSLFARQSFWDGLRAFADHGLNYADYSYADKADVFTRPLDKDGLEQLIALLPLLKARSTADRLARLRPDRLDCLSRR